MRFVARRFTLCVALGLAVVSMPAATGTVFAAEPIRAVLDGQRIPIDRISQYYCHDLERPLIRCFSSAAELEASHAANRAALAASVIYVTVYDLPSYAGSFMQISSDYDVLALVGWNDRISSYKARNSETGSFYTDWYHAGTADHFCCNESVPILGGGFNDAFSSVYRT